MNAVTTIVQPNEIARFVATKYWGPIQKQQRVAKNTWCVETGGHGGIVCIFSCKYMDRTDVLAPHIDKAKLARVLSVDHAWNRIVCQVLSCRGSTHNKGWKVISTEYGDSWNANPYMTNDSCELWTVIVGEEDSDHRILMHLSDDVRTGYNKLLVSPYSPEELEDKLKYYSEWYINAVEEAQWTQLG